MIQWPCLAARPNILIITFILTPSSQANGVSMSASSRRSRYNLLRALYHNASMAKWFNKRFIAAKLNNMILRLLYHNAGVTAVTLLTVSAYKSSQNLYFIEKNSLQNRCSCACFQLGIKICLSTPQDAQVVNQVFKIGGELFWFPKDEAASRYFACSLKEITVL